MAILPLAEFQQFLELVGHHHSRSLRGARQTVAHFGIATSSFGLYRVACATLKKTPTKSLSAADVAEKAQKVTVRVEVFYFTAYASMLMTSFGNQLSLVWEKTDRSPS